MTSELIAYRVTELVQLEFSTRITLEGTDSHRDSEMTLEVKGVPASEMRIYVGDEYDITIQPHRSRDHN